MAKRIYISGKITGYDNYVKHFKNVELKLLSLGYDVVNPGDPKYEITNPMLDDYNDDIWLLYMDRDIRWVKQCDAILMLSNWQDSPGANIEYWVAKKYNKEIMYETDLV